MSQVNRLHFNIILIFVNLPETRLLIRETRKKHKKSKSGDNLLIIINQISKILLNYY